ncbi:MAG: DEAD/DEAH box helicase [Promethearchaeota archaeon]
MISNNNHFSEELISDFLEKFAFHKKSIQFFTEKLGFTHLNYLQQNYIKDFLTKNKTLVIAPTSSGKTIIAFIKMVYILQNKEIKKRFIYMLPYLQLLNEKLEELSIFEYFDLKVSQNIDEYQSGEINILVCTFHQMDEYLQFNPSLDEPDLFIFDELDVLGTTFFGPIVESVIANFLSLKILNNVLSITATVGDMKTLAEWLNNSEILEILDYRPVPLYKEVIYNSKGISPETLLDLYTKQKDIRNRPILVIIYNKLHIESLAANLARLIREIDINLDELTTKFDKSSYINEIIFNLKHGVGIFHADIPKKIQKFTIENYNKGILPFLIASPSLARGVNLNCRTVVIRPTLPYGKSISKCDYEQISGRAGRKNLQDKGFSIIIAKDEAKQKEYKEKYIEGELEPLISGFFDGEIFNSNAFELDVLKTIALTDSDKKSLYNKYKNYYFVTGMPNDHMEEFLEDIISTALKDLKNMGFVQMGRTKYVISDIGKFYIRYHCSSIPGFGLQQYYQLVHKIGNNILENEYSITVSNYYEIIRKVVNILDEQTLIKFISRKKEERINIRERITNFIRNNCGLFESTKFLRDLTFVVLVNYMIGKKIEGIEVDYLCSVPSFYKIRIIIPKVLDVLRNYVSNFFSLAENNEDEDWMAIISYLKESLKYGIPIRHIPFRQNIPAKKINRNAWLELVSGLQNKYGNSLNSYDEIFKKEQEFTYVPQIGPIRNATIINNVENIIRSESRLNILLDKYNLEFPFKVKIRN